MTAAGVTTDTVLTDLEAGRVRAAWPDDSAADGWRIDPAVKQAILGCFADRTTTTGRSAHSSSAIGLRSRRGPSRTARGGSCPAARPFAPGRTWRRTSS